MTGGFTGNDTLSFRVLNHPDRMGLLVTDLTDIVVLVPSTVILGIFGLSVAGWKLRRCKE
jgi:hypothetical protein